MSDQILINIGPAAETLGVSKSTLCRLIDRGTIPSVKIGSRRLVERAELELYVESLRATA